MIDEGLRAASALARRRHAPERRPRAGECAAARACPSGFTLISPVPLVERALENAHRQKVYLAELTWPVWMRAERQVRACSGLYKSTYSAR